MHRKCKNRFSFHLSAACNFNSDKYLPNIIVFAIGVLRLSVNDIMIEIDKIDIHPSVFCDYRFRSIF